MHADSYYTQPDDDASEEDFDDAMADVDRLAEQALALGYVVDIDVASSHGDIEFNLSYVAAKTSTLQQKVLFSGSRWFSSIEGLRDALKELVPLTDDDE